jgi:hypothetical protein
MHFLQLYIWYRYPKIILEATGLPKIQWVFFAWFWFLTSFWFFASNSYLKPSLSFFENLPFFQNHLSLFWKKQNWNELVAKTI